MIEFIEQYMNVYEKRYTLQTIGLNIYNCMLK